MGLVNLFINPWSSKKLSTKKTLLKSCSNQRKSYSWAHLGFFFLVTLGLTPKVSFSLLLRYFDFFRVLGSVGSLASHDLWVLKYLTKRALIFSRKSRGSSNFPWERWSGAYKAQAYPKVRGRVAGTSHKVTPPQKNLQAKGFGAPIVWGISPKLAALSWIRPYLSTPIRPHRQFPPRIAHKRIEMICQRASVCPAGTSAWMIQE